MSGAQSWDLTDLEEYCTFDDWPTFVTARTLQKQSGGFYTVAEVRSHTETSIVCGTSLKEVSDVEAASLLMEAGHPVPDDLQRAARQSLRKAKHSTDYRSVHWYGVDHSFTADQAAVVRILWENWQNGTPDVGQETLLGAAGVEVERLLDVFRRGGKKHEALGTMIVKGNSKGSFRLQEPPEDFFAVTQNPRECPRV